MGYDPDSPSHEGHDEDDEDEYEEPAGGNHFLGFMFGNVDGSGDLDVDYLDDDAKEHFAALANKLGSSLKDIDLSVNSLQTPSDATDQDYDRKAENAVDFEDFDEQYEGPEVQAATEEDFLLPKKDFFTTEVSATTLENRTSVFDDENYDEDDDDMEKQNMVVESNIEAQQKSPPVEQKYNQEVLTRQESLQEDMHVHSPEVENLDTVESMEDDSYSSDNSVGGDKSSLLPILCVEDGKAILRFSEIFGIQEPTKKREKREYRYTTHKEKYKSIDVNDIVEEDEEKFLREPCQDFHWMRHWHIKSGDVMLDEEDASVKSGIGNTSLRVDAQRKDYCASSEPMKDEASLSTYSESKSPFSSNYYPLDQHDWEDKIIWNNSPLSTENFVESCELSGPDSDNVADKEKDLEAETQTLESEIISKPQDKDHCSFLKSLSILVEPLGSNIYSTNSMNVPITGNRKHPQLLRLEARVDKDNLNNEGPDDVAAAEAKHHSDAIRRFSQLTLQNRDVLEGSWLDDIVWEPHQSVAKPKLILDLQDEQMLFELSDMKDSNNIQLHARAMIISRSVLPKSGDSLEGHGNGILSAGRFNISNDKFYSNRKSSQQLRSHSKKRAIHGLKVLHSVPALKLQTMKAKLSNKDVANFHRPKALWYPHDIEVPLAEVGKLASQGPIKIIMKSLGGKGSKLHVNAEETILSLKEKASKKLDFKLSEPVKIFYSGRVLEDDKSLAEQSVRPNSVLHLIRTKIHMLPRAQKLPGENKSRRPPGAFKKKSDLSVKDGHIFLMEYCEERPLLIGNAGMGARLCTYYQKSAPGDETGNLLRNDNKGFGSIVILDPADKSPFLGDIKPGSSQSCIETNMYRAPIFQHKVSSTDYLLVRSPKGKLSIRRIDRIDVVGQQEPHIEVMFPGSKNAQFYIMNRLLVHMYREFRASQKCGLRPSIRSAELSSQFPSLSEAILRKRLKSFADLQRDPTGNYLWVMKRSFRIPSEEELRRMVTPESVCAYESMQAGLYRLKRLGITRLTLPTGLSAAMNQIPDEAITLAAASHIERELQITPWNLSSNFVSCTNQHRENIERLEITGVGDPSGRGLGFSYVRSIPKAPVSNAMVKKKTVVGKGSSVTGTDADLRRLSMDDARELLLKFNETEDEIAKLTRWHRIAKIRKLSSEQAASGVKVDPTTVGKFARGQRMSFLQLQQQTREKCQEVWDRQVQSLCSADGEEIESESEANSDLDSFAGDLENLLDAEAFEDGEDDNFDSKNVSVDGVKGLKMRRRPLETQAEEENEDEAAEAAELCKMLMDGDNEADQKRNQKTKAVVEQSGFPIKSKFGSESTAGTKKINAVDKGIMQPEGLYLLTESIAREKKEAGSLSAKKHLPGKVKGNKMIEIEPVGILKKKIKFLGDGIPVVKEKKPARDNFVCGACGQLGHMRTNKHCPKYREDSDTRAESIYLEKPSGGTNFVEQRAEQKLPPKMLVPKTLTRAETPEDDKPTSKAKVLKVKCASADKLPVNLISPTSQTSDIPFIVDVESGNRSVVKVNKITFAKKNKPEDVMVDSYKPSIVIKPPVDAEKDQPRKKIIIKQPKEIINLDESSQDGSFGFDYRKTKKITELSSFNKRREDESNNLFEESSRTRDTDSVNQWREEKRRNADRQQEERNMRPEKIRMIDKQPNWRWLEEKGRNAERQQEEINRRPDKMRMIDEQPQRNIKMYEDFIRKERDNAKKNKKRKPEMRDDDFMNLPPRRNDRKKPERDRMARRKQAPEYGYQLEHAPAPKRRRGGEVTLANILERIVDTIKGRHEISYLFLKPVSKKEAPDYYNIINHPMDLSTIKEKVRKLNYKNRDEFREDMSQIVFNAHKYNQCRYPHIPPLADQVLELCDILLDQNYTSLTEAEEGIEQI